MRCFCFRTAGVRDFVVRCDIYEPDVLRLTSAHHTPSALLRVRLFSPFFMLPFLLLSSSLPCSAQCCLPSARTACTHARTFAPPRPAPRPTAAAQRQGGRARAGRDRPAILPPAHPHLRVRTNAEKRIVAGMSFCVCVCVDFLYSERVECAVEVAQPFVRSIAVAHLPPSPHQVLFLSFAVQSPGGNAVAVLAARRCGRTTSTFPRMWRARRSRRSVRRSTTSDRPTRRRARPTPRSTRSTRTSSPTSLPKLLFSAF